MTIFRIVVFGGTSQPTLSKKPFIKRTEFQHFPLAVLSCYSSNRIMLGGINYSILRISFDDEGLTHHWGPWATKGSGERTRGKLKERTKEHPKRNGVKTNDNRYRIILFCSAPLIYEYAVPFLMFTNLY
jgi:hypothetical protein